MTSRVTSVLFLVAGCRLFDAFDKPTETTGDTTPTMVTVTDPTETTVPLPPPFDCSSPPQTSPAAPCAVPVDEVAVAACATGGHAALLGGVGYPSVQEAIASAVPGDTVKVCPGIWTGPVTIDAEITLAAADPTEGATVLDAAGGEAVTVAAMSSLVGFTVTHGFREVGGGILVTAPDVLLECLTLDDNTATDSGGGLSTWEDGVVLRASTIRNNAAPHGGGIEVRGRFTIVDSTFESNASSVRHGGGAALVGDVVIERTVFANNLSLGDGGALSWGSDDPYTLKIRDTVFHCNSAMGDGGAMTVGTWADDTVEISGSSFAGNATDGVGGAIDFTGWGSVGATITDTTFVGNSAFDEAGALQLGGWLERGFSVTLADVAFEENLANDEGSAISLGVQVPFGHFEGSSVTFRRNWGGNAAISLACNAAAVTFDCTGCDVGAGADDNTPNDAIEPGGGTREELTSDFSL